MAIGFKCVTCGKRTEPNDTVTVCITSLRNPELNKLCTLCTDCGLELNQQLKHQPKQKENQDHEQS